MSQSNSNFSCMEGSKMKRVCSAIVLCSMLALVGCGGGDSGPKIETPANPEAAPAQPPVQSGDAGAGANVAPPPPSVSPDDK